MPDYLGNDQRKTKDDEEDKPFQSTYYWLYLYEAYLAQSTSV